MVSRAMKAAPQIQAPEGARTFPVEKMMEWCNGRREAAKSDAEREAFARMCLGLAGWVEQCGPNMAVAEWDQLAIASGIHSPTVVKGGTWVEVTARVIEPPPPTSKSPRKRAPRVVSATATA